MLQGKTALVTGASRGIGRAIATEFQSQGARVVLVSRNHERVQAAARDLGTDVFYALDVGDAKAWIEIAKDIPKLDVLVNAAGITQTSLSMHTPPAMTNKILDTNLCGTIHGCNAMTKALLKTKGSILNIASVIGFHGGRGMAMYAASKAGIIGYTIALANELSPNGVRVNAICPGYIETDMTSAFQADHKKKLMSKALLNRFGTPEEIAHAALYLTTNTFSTASVLTVDGGLSKAE